MENLISLFYAFCGLSYTILAGKGKFICFVFGILSSTLYSFLSFKEALWGNFLLNFLYYLPMQFISLYKWYKNTDLKKKTVKKTSLGLKKFLFFCLIGLLAGLITTYILFLNHDKSPILDGFIMIFSILGMYLTLLRAIEQWIIWTIVNFMTLLMWVILILQGSSAIPVAILWGIYLILGIKFYWDWKKELRL